MLDKTPDSLVEAVKKQLDESVMTKKSMNVDVQPAKRLKGSGAKGSVKVYDVEVDTDTGRIYMYTDSELDAYKAAYAYKSSDEVVVEWAAGVKRWQVMVKNKK